ncbi:metalloregulator ArsR/SmtB family transcription factor [Nocardiopsis dassonvillei]|uniref:ArsR/SmtB family transcription factor n=1 Tax=Nocardiopsis dassonvillei TaxID=2014 RepID=UPI00200E398D|nr:metalloregulator ArsR/SmtB family transcription factor [Nocardiopsis dassonvillei]MCK9871313.1 metalloregulator ArsR/SmtB family transcription factor [Nocardiopsis dassonvillei]
MDGTHLDERGNRSASGGTSGSGPEPAYSPQGADDIATLLKAAADPTRLRLLHALATADGGGMYVQDLADLLQIGQPTTSHHLRKLFDADLVERRKEGKRSWYSLAPGRATGLRSLLGLTDPSA